MSDRESLSNGCMERVDPKRDLSAGFTNNGRRQIRFIEVAEDDPVTGPLSQLPNVNGDPLHLVLIKQALSFAFDGITCELLVFRHQD